MISINAEVDRQMNEWCLTTHGNLLDKEGSKAEVKFWQKPLYIRGDSALCRADDLSGEHLTFLEE